MSSTATIAAPSIKPPVSEAPRARGLLQRKCACGGETGASGECAECTKKKLLQRREAGSATASDVPSIVHDVLNLPGQPLDSSTRSFMEPRFGRDFSGVRIHTDTQSAQSAQAVNAHAYTVGKNVVFGAGRYTPSDRFGRELLAHELTHVVQQHSSSVASATGPLTMDRPDSHREMEAQKIGADVALGRTVAFGNSHSSHAQQIISRASPDAVGYSMRLGLAARTGIQFSPSNVTDSQVGPTSVQGGLLNGGSSRLNVIVGENLSLRRLARQILPLWTTATPFTPAGAVGPLPLDIITEDELAQGLLVFNRYYLPVPAMMNWRSGLRFPLPVELDELTGMATLHPLRIRALATGFDPAWLPLLDVSASRVAAAPVATLQADATAFLARETTPLARGMHLAARALTNASAELPFIREVFRQLGTASFEVALEFMDTHVNREVSLLATQRDGAAILAEIRIALAAAPTALSAEQQARVTRANLMLGLVAAVAAQPPPTSARTRAEKTITVDTLKLDGSNHDPSTDIAMANAIFSQCNVRVVHGRDETATNLQTTGWLGGDTDLHSGNNCNAPSPEERALFRDARTALALTARFTAFFAPTASGISASGYSCNPADGMAALFQNRLIVLNSGDTATLAHELGHILIRLSPHPAAGLMSARPAAPAMRLPLISEAHCTRLYNNA
jgi:Domain of unknown function (DUF4157)